MPTANNIASNTLSYPSKSLNGYKEGTTPFLLFNAYYLKDEDRKVLAYNMTTKPEPASVSLVLPIPVAGLSTDEKQEWMEESGIAGNFAQEIIAQGTAWVAGIDFLGTGSRVISQYGAVNDLASLLYKAAAMRNFSFSWNLIPTSKFEADTIIQIADTFRLNSHGSNIARNSIQDGTSKASQVVGEIGNRGAPIIANPPFWKIQAIFAGQVIFGTDWCVIENVKVDRKGNDSVFTLFKDGSFPQVQLDVSFKEMFRHTQESLKGSDRITAKYSAMSPVGAG